MSKEKSEIVYPSIKSAELFEIANKYHLYKKSASKWYLKPLYAAAYSIAVFLAKKEVQSHR